jgi:very-short-patch-repair endonuclease
LSVHAHDDLPEPVQIGDLAVAPCEEAWLQVCESVAALACVEVGDGLVRYTDPLTSLNALERAIAANPGRRGIRTAMRALGMIRPGTDSLPETTTRIHLEAEGISGLLVNPTLRTRQGEFLGRVDMFDPATYTCVEYDGEVHGDEGQRRKDIARRRRIEDQGCPVIVAAAKDLYNPEGLARTVRRVQSEQAEALAARRLVDLPIVHPYEPALP